MKTRKVLKSGSTLDLNYTSFRNVKELIQNIARVFKNNLPEFKIDSELVNITDTKLTKDILEKLIPTLLDGICDNQLIDSIFRCGDNSLINEERITEEYFEEVENRKDYIQVLKEITIYNIQPFFPKVPMNSKPTQMEQKK